MAYKSNLTAVMYAIHAAKHDFCTGVGTLIKAEVQSVTPVGKSTPTHTGGNLKKCIDTDVMEDDKGVYVGVTPEAKYGLWVNEGSSKQPAQHFLQNGANNAIPKIVNVATKVYKQRMNSK